MSDAYVCQLFGRSVIILDIVAPEPKFEFSAGMFLFLIS
jgi:hypothetical protein